MRKQDTAEKRYVQRRRAVMAAARRESKVESILVTHPVNIRYLTGCPEGASGLLMGRDWAVLFVGRMFEHVAPSQAPGVEVVVPEAPGYRAVADALRMRKLRSAVGFEGQTLAWRKHAALRDAMGRRKLVTIDDVVKRVRSVKDADEITLIRRCVKIAEKAFLELLGRGTDGLLALSERELAAELEYMMRRLGADRQAFPENGIIVASGPNSASCHHAPTGRKPRRGEPLLFDWGAEIDGYRSDITRTCFLGEPDPRLREVYAIVERANAVGRKAVRPGVACSTVAARSWDVVRAAGWGAQIRHGLGHGLGLDIHELPVFGNGEAHNARSSTRLRRNMVVTVEPGIYLSGVGGVRIEDDLLVTARGHSVLTSLPRGLDAAILS